MNRLNAFIDGCLGLRDHRMFKEAAESVFNTWFTKDSKPWDNSPLDYTGAYQDIRSNKAYNQRDKHNYKYLERQRIGRAASYGNSNVPPLRTAINSASKLPTRYGDAAMYDTYTKNRHTDHTYTDEGSPVYYPKDMLKPQDSLNLEALKTYDALRATKKPADARKALRDSGFNEPAIDYINHLIRRGIIQANVQYPLDRGVRVYG